MPTPKESYWKFQGERVLKSPNFKWKVWSKTGISRWIIWWYRLVRGRGVGVKTKQPPEEGYGYLLENMFWIIDSRTDCSFDQIRVRKSRSELWCHYCFPFSVCKIINTWMMWCRHREFLWKYIEEKQQLYKHPNACLNYFYIFEDCDFPKRSFKYSGAMLWNNLSYMYEAKTAQSLSDFKHKLASSLSMPSTGSHWFRILNAYNNIYIVRVLYCDVM